jgi:hypothetical protein
LAGIFNVPTTKVRTILNMLFSVRISIVNNMSQTLAEFLEIIPECLPPFSVEVFPEKEVMKFSVAASSDLEVLSILHTALGSLYEHVAETRVLRTASRAV